MCSWLTSARLMRKLHRSVYINFSDWNCSYVCQCIPICLIYIYMIYIYIIYICIYIYRKNRFSLLKHSLSDDGPSHFIALSSAFVIWNIKINRALFSMTDDIKNLLHLKCEKWEKLEICYPYDKGFTQFCVLNKISLMWCHKGEMCAYTNLLMPYWCLLYTHNKQSSLSSGVWIMRI